MSPEEYKAHRENLGLTQAGLAARLLGSEARRTTIVKREAGLQEITEEMALALRALKPAKTKNATGGSNTDYRHPQLDRAVSPLEQFAPQLAIA